MTTSRRRRAGRGGRALVPVALLALGPLLVAHDAAATASVYHSELDDGVDTTPGEPDELDHTTAEAVHLYITGGDQGTGIGTVCEDGNGDELCAFDVRIEVQGAGHIVDFQEDDPDIAFEPTDFSGGPTALRLNAVRAVAPLPATVPVRLGTLVVDTSETSGPTSVVVTGVQSVGAAGQLETIPSEIVAEALPEPGPGWLLGGGLLGVALLHRWRCRALRRADVAA